MSDTAKFSFPGLTRIRTIPGPSSMIHAVLNAYWIPYRANKYNDNPIERAEIVWDIREEMARRLPELDNPEQSQYVRVYDILSKGLFQYLGQHGAMEYSINMMMGELMDREYFINDKYLELLSNHLNHDIYILCAATKDVWLMENQDVDTFYKNRAVVVILALPYHFERWV